MAAITSHQAVFFYLFQQPVHHVTIKQTKEDRGEGHVWNLPSSKTCYICTDVISSLMISNAIWTSLTYKCLLGTWNYYVQQMFDSLKVWIKRKKKTSMKHYFRI